MSINTAEDNRLAMLVAGVIHWLKTKDASDMVEERGYRKSFYSFPFPVSQSDLSEVCDIINELPEGMGLGKVTDSMGEIFVARGGA